jgi:hypothetical protein
MHSHQLLVQYAGHTSQLPAAGDYLTGELLGCRYIVCRGEDGQLRAFHNVSACWLPVEHWAWLVLLDAPDTLSWQAAALSDVFVAAGTIAPWHDTEPNIVAAPALPPPAAMQQAALRPAGAN